MWRMLPVVFAIYVPGVAWLQASYVPPDTSILRTILPRQQHSYRAFPFIPGADGDNEKHPAASSVEVFENGVALGPAHSSPADISNLGQGRYLFVRDGDTTWLVFSSSDNTDPRTNGRTYRAVDPLARDPYASALRRPR
ncbi:hypothetical protein ACQ86E_05775 [Bradyrhizobium betae]|uniref:hypothetical protein n=1 Tax=Bradyrhizobium betae TaxID=244734 RepID=UPI003D67E1E1